MATAPDDPRLDAVWAAFHERLCRGEGPTDVKRVTVADATAPTLALLNLLLTPRTPFTSRQVHVPLDRLCDVLVVTPADAAGHAVRVAGPVADRPAARASARGVRDALWAHADRRLAAAPGVAARLRAGGITDGQVAQIRRVIDAVADVLDRIPFDPPRPLAKVAHDVTGDPHFFDHPSRETCAGGRLTAAVAEWAGRPGYVPSGGDVDAVLLAAGIIKDRISSTVVALNLTATGDTPVGRMLNAMVGLPVNLTAYHLSVAPPTPTVTAVLVTENPSLIEAALERGDDRAMLCTQGVLRSVDHAALRWLADAGVALTYVGDADRQGQGVARLVAGLYAAEVIDLPPGVTFQEHDVAIARVLG